MSSSGFIFRTGAKGQLLIFAIVAVVVVDGSEETTSPTLTRKSTGAILIAGCVQEFFIIAPVPGAPAGEAGGSTAETRTA